MPHIPNEILYLIFDYFNREPVRYGPGPPVSWRFSELSQLLLVCRAWYRILVAQVYLSLEVDHPQRRLFRLARSFRENSVLASFVQGLWIGGYDLNFALYTDIEDFTVFIDSDEDGILDNPHTQPFRDILIRACPDRRERFRWQHDLIYLISHFHDQPLTTLEAIESTIGITV